MDFADRIGELSTNAAKWTNHIETEEATKTSLIMPMIRALGYDPNNPTEVVPEFTADVGSKKGEKVDYAILKDNEPIILLECKWCGADLDKAHASQLYRYFTVTDARFGVLTNGVTYRFFSDLEEPNRMDAKPFFEFNLIDDSDAAVTELKKFTKDAFDLEGILTTASELKYTREIKRLLGEELREPSQEFVRYFASRVYPGRLTQAMKDQFTRVVRKSFQQFVSDRISDRLKSALAEENVPRTNEAEEVSESEIEDKSDGVNTTVEEMEAFFVVKSILRDKIDVSRVAMRDTKSYCGILLDDNNRKPICRFRFDGSKKYLGLIGTGKEENRVLIGSLDEIYGHADAIMAAACMYDESVESN